MCSHHDRDPRDRVTVAEVNDFLSDTLRLDGIGSCAPLPDRIAHQRRKARLLTRIADELDTAQAHATAAGAWRRLTELLAQANQADDVAEAGDA